MMPEFLLFVLIIVGLVTVFAAWMTMGQDTGIFPFAVIITIIWLGLVYWGYVWVTGPSFGTYGRRDVEMIWRNDTVYIIDTKARKIVNVPQTFGIIPSKNQKAYVDYDKGGSYAGIWSYDSDIPNYHLEKAESEDAKEG